MSKELSANVNAKAKAAAEREEKQKQKEKEKGLSQQKSSFRGTEVFKGPNQNQYQSRTEESKRRDSRRRNSSVSLESRLQRRSSEFQLKRTELQLAELTARAPSATSESEESDSEGTGTGTCRANSATRLGRSLLKEHRKLEKLEKSRFSAGRSRWRRPSTEREGLLYEPTFRIAPDKKELFSVGRVESLLQSIIQKYYTFGCPEKDDRAAPKKQDTLLDRQSESKVSADRENQSRSQRSAKNREPARPRSSSKKLIDDPGNNCSPAMKHSTEIECPAVQSRTNTNRKLCLGLSEIIKQKVKTLGFSPRYRFVCLVSIGTGVPYESVAMVSRFLWDQGLDNFASFHCVSKETASFLVATVFALYRE